MMIPVPPKADSGFVDKLGYMELIVYEVYSQFAGDNKGVMGLGEVGKMDTLPGFELAISWLKAR